MSFRSNIRKIIIDIFTKWVNHLNEKAAQEYSSTALRHATFAAQNCTKNFGSSLKPLRTAKRGWIYNALNNAGVTHMTGNTSLLAGNINIIALKAINMTYKLPTNFKEGVVFGYQGWTMMTSLSGSFFSFKYLLQNDIISLSFILASVVIDSRSHYAVTFAKNATNVNIPSYCDLLAWGCRHIVKMRRGTQNDFITILELCGMVKYWKF